MGCNHNFFVFASFRHFVCIGVIGFISGRDRTLESLLNFSLLQMVFEERKGHKMENNDENQNFQFQ